MEWSSWPILLSFLRMYKTGYSRGHFYEGIKTTVSWTSSGGHFKRGRFVAQPIASGMMVVVNALRVMVSAPCWLQAARLLHFCVSSSFYLYICNSLSVLWYVMPYAVLHLYSFLIL